MPYIKFPSHRARQYALRELEARGVAECQAYYSWRRSEGNGIYLVTDEQLAVLDHAHSQHVRFTRLRGPFDDLRMCW